ncbi:MAG: hypothetical protein ABEI31_10445 [Halodesulfurarchaeum sp.]
MFDEAGSDEYVECPVEGCEYAGLKAQVVPHIVKTDDWEHTRAQVTHDLSYDHRKIPRETAQDD